MRQDLAMAGHAPGTQARYLAAAARFVRRFMRPPEEMGQAHLREHMAELGASGIGASAMRVQIAGLRFLYKKTLGRPDEVAWMSFPRAPRGLPRVLDRTEIAALLGAMPSPLHRMVALAMYATGLRVGEAVALQVVDIDAARGVIRVRRGKGGVARETMLGPKLLEALRAPGPSSRAPRKSAKASPDGGTGGADMGYDRPSCNASGGSDDERAWLGAGGPRGRGDGVRQRQLEPAGR
jgi:integrase/recombinase XerD